MGFAEWQIVGSRGGKMSVICSLENHARSWRRTVRFFLLLGCAFTTNAYAHKVNVFAYLEGDRVYVQGYFLDGYKAKKNKHEKKQPKQNQTTPNQNKKQQTPRARNRRIKRAALDVRHSGRIG